MPNATLENAIALVRQNPEVIGVSLLQRHLLIGYNAGLTLMSELIAKGIVTTIGAAEKERLYLLVNSDDNSL